MSFSPSFDLGQNPASPNIVVAIDDSTGSDGAITQRRIFIQDAQGTYLVPAGTMTNYTQWAIGQGTISLNILTQNTAVTATVQWLDVSNNVLYTSTEQFPLALFGQQFLYYLVQLQGLTPSIPADTNYDANTAILWAAILGGINAVTINNDIAAAQNSFNRATYMQQNQSLFF